MRAVVVEAGELVIAEVPPPVPGPGQLLVAVRAAGLNRADLLARRGRYVVGASLRPGGAAPVEDPAAARPPAVAGGEVAGEVVATGPGVTNIEVGQRVMAMARGGYAEFAVADARRAMRIPDRLTWTQAAAVPTTFCTAHDALRTAGRVQPGDVVLVNAASSGVGVATLQLARLLGAGTVVAVSTTAAKLDALVAAGIGPDHGFVGDDPDLVDAIIDATGGHGVDVVIDNVGGPAWATNLAVAALGGRIVSVGRLGGDRAEVDLDEVARKRVSLVGVTFRTRDADQSAAVVTSFVAEAGPALDDGRLVPLVAATFPLIEAAAAQAELATNRHIGKIVLEVS